jgi:NADPH:quinone reductase-like Zn-dependent oxidoreductase
MKAVVYEKGKPHNALVYQEVEKPICNENEVLVKIYATSINAGDYRSMKMGIIPKRKIFGSDIAGKVNAVGKNITKFKIGDEVFGDISFCGFGGFAEYVAVDESTLALKPDSVSFESAAAVPMASLTALQGLRNIGNISQGKKVLICGAGGGVGTFAVQLAKYYGAEVTAVCGGKNVQIVQSLGADYVLDYNINDFTTGSNRYDLILAVNGKHSLSDYKHTLAANGIFVLVGGALSQVIKSLLFGRFMSIGNKKMRFLAAKLNVTDLEFIINLVKDGTIKPIIDRNYPLQETAEAMKYISNGHALGKVIITVV